MTLYNLHISKGKLIYNGCLKMFYKFKGERVNNIYIIFKSILFSWVEQGFIVLHINPWVERRNRYRLIIMYQIMTNLTERPFNIRKRGI